MENTRNITVLPATDDPALQRVADLARPLLAAANTSCTILGVKFSENTSAGSMLLFNNDPTRAILYIRSDVIERSSDEQLRGLIGHEIAHTMTGDIRRMAESLEAVQNEMHSPQGRAIRAAHVFLCATIALGEPCIHAALPPPLQPVGDAADKMALVMLGVEEAAQNLIQEAKKSIRHTEEFRCDAISVVLAPQALQATIPKLTEQYAERLPSGTSLSAVLAKESPTHPSWQARLANIEELESPRGETRREKLAARYLRQDSGQER